MHLHGVQRCLSHFVAHLASPFLMRAPEGTPCASLVVASLLWARSVAAAPAVQPVDSLGHAAAPKRELASVHRVPMNGACAVVARSNVWVKESKDGNTWSRTQRICTFARKEK